MYCKYCGAKIGSNIRSCPRCNADIDIYDGGQSFFEDGDLDMWKNERIIRGQRTMVPRTEFMENESGSKTDREFSGMQSPTVNTVGKRVRKRSKSVIEKIFDFFNLSASNRIIAVFITLVFIVIFIVAGIIALVNRENGEENIGGEESYSTQTPVRSDFNSADTIYEATALPVGKEELADIRIFVNDEEISHPVPAYMSGGSILYISVDRILKHEGYQSGRADEYNPRRVIYENLQTGSIIEIEKDTSQLWIRDLNNSSAAQSMEEAAFNVNSDTYVPAKSFLELCGYTNIEFDSEKKELSFKRK